MRPVILFGSALLVCAASASAQVPRSTPISVTRGEFSISPYAGYLISESLVEGPLNTALGVTNAPVYGIQASLPLAPSASLVGTFGYASGDLEVGLPVIGGIGVGSSSATVFDAAVELRGSLGAARFLPLVQLGGGAMHRRVTVAGLTGKTTDFVVSGGVGADLPITHNVAMRFMAKDYYGKADFGSLGSYSAKTRDIHTLAISGGIRIAF